MVAVPDAVVVLVAVVLVVKSYFSQDQLTVLTLLIQVFVVCRNHVVRTVILVVHRDRHGGGNSVSHGATYPNTWPYGC